MTLGTLLVWTYLIASPQDPYIGLRMKMIEQHIALRGVKTPAVLEVMRRTPRHAFVPASEVEHAYEDRPLPIGYGATISQPYIVAVMTEMLDVRPGNRVLEIGTGSGYQAAVLAQLARHVYSMELVPELARRATETLQKLGYDNVTVRQGDGYQGWPELAPFDRILLTAAPPSVPEALVAQLRPGGKLVAPVGELDQYLYLIEKLPNGSVVRRLSMGVRFVPMVTGPER